MFLYWNILTLNICETFGHEEFEGIKRLPKINISSNSVIWVRYIAWKDKPFLYPHSQDLSSLRR